MNGKSPGSAPAGSLTHRPMVKLVARAELEVGWDVAE